MIGPGGGGSGREGATGPAPSDGTAAHHPLPTPPAAATNAAHRRRRAAVAASTQVAGIDTEAADRGAPPAAGLRCQPASQPARGGGGGGGCVRRSAPPRGRWAVPD